MLTRFIAYLSLIILSLIIPFLLNRPAKNVLRKLMPPAIAVLLILLVITIGAVFSGGLYFSGFLKLVVFLLCYSIMMVSLYLLMISFGVSGNLTQVIVTVLFFLMLGTVFYANPFIEAASSGQLRQGIIQWSININPILIIGAEVFGDDMIHFPLMYHFSQIGDYWYCYPPLGYVLLGYLVISVACLGVSFLIRIKDVSRTN